jgi:hypothetical protein
MLEFYEMKRQTRLQEKEPNFHSPRLEQITDNQKINSKGILAVSGGQ